MQNKYLTQEVQEFGHQQYQLGFIDGRKMGFEEGKTDGRKEGHTEAILKVLDSINDVQITPKRSQEIDITNHPNETTRHTNS